HAHPDLHACAREPAHRQRPLPAQSAREPRMEHRLLHRALAGSLDLHPRASGRGIQRRPRRKIPRGGGERPRGVRDRRRFVRRGDHRRPRPALRRVAGAERLPAGAGDRSGARGAPRRAPGPRARCPLTAARGSDLRTVPHRTQPEPVAFLRRGLASRGETVLPARALLRAAPAYFLPDEFFDLIDPSDVELPGSFAETFANKPQVQKNYSTYWSADSFEAEQWRKIIAIYRGYVAMIDHEVGLLLEELDRQGLREETSIFFTADHGEFTGAHRLNDKGPAAYDDILNIPLLVHVPEVSHSGQSDAFVSLIDIPATILDL